MDYRIVINTRRLIANAASVLVLAATAHAQTQCRFDLANHADGNSGILLALESALDASGKCSLSGVNVRLNVGDGTAMHHVDGSFAWQIGVVYTVKAMITAAGPQQLLINDQTAGSVQAAFKPSQATFSASLTDDAPGAMESYMVTQISLQVSNGSNTLSVAPNGNNPLPIRLILLAGGPAPWQSPFTENPAQMTTITATFRFDPIQADVHQFDPYIDQYGQAISASWPSKILNDSDLQTALAKEQTWLANNGPLGGMDQYGGSMITGWPPGKATGYYQAAFQNNRWYLISPLGNPLFYLGVTAIPSYATPITGREAMFKLPPQTGTYADAYSLNANNETQNTTYFSFPVSNQIRKFGTSSKDVKNAHLAQRLASWAFTGGGKFGDFPQNMVSTPILLHGGAPGVPNAVPGGHPDVFDPSVVSKLTAELTKEIGSNVTNPYILGWSVGNETEQIVTNAEVQAILDLGASSPAKKALVDHALSVTYQGNISSLAKAWGISASTVAEVYASMPQSEPDLDDLQQFYEKAYYSTLYHTVKAVDPNHLYFGSWIPAGDSKNWPAAAANCDVVGFDDFTAGPLDPDLQALFASANKPVLLGAWGVPSDYAGARGFGWNQYTQAMTLSDSASGDAYARELASIATNRYVVGAMLFDYLDEPLTGRGNSDGIGNIKSDLVIAEDFAFGLVDVTDTPKYDLVDKVRAANIAALQSLGLLGSAPILTSAPANGATYLAGGLVPGSWALVQGSGLADPGVVRTWQNADFAGLGNNLPTDLSGAQVLVNGAAAAVYYVSPTQINFQVPAGVSGTASIQVTRDGIVSNTISAQAVASSPGIFPVILGSTNYAAAVFPDGKIAADPSNGPAFRNAVPGDVVQLFATGLAPSPAGTTVSPTFLSGVTVTIGSVTVPASSVALVAVGEFQINFTVPQQFASLPAGTYPISISINGVPSPNSINSSPPGPVVLPIQH